MENVSDISSEESLAQFKQVVSAEWPKLTEADTRSKIVDPIFTKCLNWSEENITREETINKGFVDYTFASENGVKFIVEAKKTGISFNLPEDTSKRYYLLDGIISKNKDLKTAIEQASRYCYEKGIRFAVITNGSQFVVFEGLRLGSEWRKGRCLLFKSHEDIIQNYALFWNVFNKTSFTKGSFNKYLIENSEQVSFKRPIENVHNPGETLIRNNLNTYLRPITEFVFQEITQDSQIDVLKECYIPDKAYSATSGEVESYYVDRMPYYAEAQKIRYFKEATDNAGEFQLSFKQCEAFLKQDSFKGYVILLLGGIGSGKTTFIHRFFNIILGDRKRLLVFYVDFRNAPIDELEIEKYIYEQIMHSLNSKYSDTKNKILKDYEVVEPSKDSPSQYCTCIFALLKTMEYSVTLVLDNVDQHDKNYQQKIFQTTKHITDTQRIICLLALREESFVDATQKGVYDAYYTHAYHIPSPRFDKLIEARINYVIKLLETDPAALKKKLETQIEISERKNELISFFKIIQASMSRRPERGVPMLTRFLSSLSGGNMRKALKMFNNFLTSGNTNIDEMLGIYLKTGMYQIPYHAFVKSVMLGDSRFFLTDMNPYMFNVFDVNTDLSQSHFLHLRVLNHAFQSRHNISPVGRGYTEISKLKSEAEKVFIPKEAIDDSLLKLAKYDLIEFENQSQKDIANATYFSITSNGEYYLFNLTKQFVYLDLVWVDTPISDNKTWGTLEKSIFENYNDDTLTRLNMRFNRVEIFLKYLLERENNEFNLHPEYAESKFMSRRFMVPVIEQFNKEKGYILDRISAHQESTQPKDG